MKEYIAVGQNAWGKAETIQAAVKLMQKNVTRKSTMYNVFEVGPDTVVDEVSGGLSYPRKGPKPIEVIHHGKPV